MLAEDSVLLREGLTTLLEREGIDVVARVGDAESLLKRIAADQPDLVVTDIRMPPTQTTEGLEAALSILEKWPAVGVLVLSQHVEPHLAMQLLERAEGGIGYLLKDRILEVPEFVAAVKRVASGESAIDSEVVREILTARREEGPLETLTDREHEVLELMAQGWTNRGLADRLSVSLKTIETHVHNIFLKLDLNADGAEHRRVLAVLTYLNA